MPVPMELLKKLVQTNQRKIALVVADGIGGYSRSGAPSALAAAKRPNLDKLARESALGLHLPIAQGITPGSGPAHLGLFGYDPLEYDIGRGALSAAGVDFKLEKGDVAARANFATLDGDGRISDRRAGRISTEKCVELCAKLDMLEIPGVPEVEVLVRSEKEHRAMVAFRSKEKLGDAVSDTDPQKTGVAPLQAKGEDAASRLTAKAANNFFNAARQVLKAEEKANGLLMRGFSGPPVLPGFSELYQLRAAAVAVYPMYRGLSRLVGMDVLETGESFSEQLATVGDNIKKYDFFFIHYKKTDSRGEDGDAKGKTKAVEDFDGGIKKLRELPFDVLVITGDHATPAPLAGHSWHPVPIMLRAETCGADEIESFTEKSCCGGSLGTIAAVDIMPLAMACALKLGKYGA